MICKSRAASARRQGTSHSPIPSETIGVRSNQGGFIRFCAPRVVPLRPPTTVDRVLGVWGVIQDNAAGRRQLEQGMEQHQEGPKGSTVAIGDSDDVVVDSEAIGGALANSRQRSAGLREKMRKTYH